MTSIKTHLYVTARIPMSQGYILDLGCGQGIFGVIMKASKRKAEIVGVDLYLPNLNIAKKTYDHVVYADASFLPFKQKIFMYTVMIEVIEHLLEEKAKQTLVNLESLTKGTIIITTPNGFKPREPDDENIYQKHLSGWSFLKLKKMGFKVRGLAIYSRLYLFIPQFLTWYLTLFADTLMGIKKVA